MSNARKPKNAVGADASKAEAQGIEMATVTWRDLTPFEIPRYRMDWPFEAVVAAEEQRFPAMLAAILPPATRAEFASMGATQRDAYSLLDAIGDELGFTSPGE